MKSDSESSATADVLPSGLDWVIAVSDSAQARHDHPAAILHRFLRVSNKLHLAYVSLFEKRFGVTMSEFRVLMMLHNMGEAASHEVADVTGITTMSVSRAVASLERANRVVLRVDKGNRRRKLIRLTADGRRLMARLVPEVMAVNQLLFGDMAERGLKQFSRALTEVSQRVDQLPELVAAQTQQKAPRKTARKATTGTAR